MLGLKNIDIISIEGNIGSGKSTLLALLRKKYGDNDRFVFVKEPVDEWENITDDATGESVLQRFYADPKKYAFAFQMMAYISRLKILKNCIENICDNEQGRRTIVITERSLYTDKYVFAKMLHEQDNIDCICYKIYLEWFDEFAKTYPIHKIIYVDTSPTTCHERIRQRSRTGESVIAIDYLINCDSYHKEFISGLNTNIKRLALNGNNDICADPTIAAKWIKHIDAFMRVGTDDEDAPQNYDGTATFYA